MYRLMKDAEALGAKFNSEFYLTEKGTLVADFADITTAIHAVQTEMGITGTTAKEAAETISGSLASAKSAWTNLITGIGDENADLNTLLNNLIESVSTAAGNIIPRITQILSGMGEMIVQVAPVIVEQLPELISATLPALISAGAQLLAGLSTGLVGALPALMETVPEIITTIVVAISTNLPAVLESGKQLLDMFGNGILEGVPALIEKLPDVILATINFFAENFPKWVEKGMEFLGQLAFGIIEAIPDFVARLPEIITAAMDFFTREFPAFVKKGGEILGQLAMGIVGQIPELLLALPEVLTAILDAMDSWWDTLMEAGGNLLEGIWQGIKSKVGWLVDKVTGVFGDVVDGVKNFLGIASPSKVFAGIGGYMAEGLGKGWEDEYGAVKRKIEDGLDFGSASVDFVSSGVGQMQRGFSTAMQTASAMAGEIKIVVQSVLDGDVIGETAYTYVANKARAYGG